MLRDLARLDMGSEVDEWDDAGVIEFSEEYIGDCPYGYSSYDGNGPGPLGIGYQLDSWAYWELEGSNGIIESARKTEDPESLLKRWNTVVPEEIQNVLTKHDLKPRVFWATSTS
jgi:hypothetical protein